MLFNTNYKPVRPPDYQSKFKIPYQKQTDFYNVEVYNDGLYLLEKELENIELTDEKLHVVTEDKKLSEVLPTVARKGEILPQDIKGNTYKMILADMNLTRDGDLAISGIRDGGFRFGDSCKLSNIYAKKTALESLQTSNSKEIESLISKTSSLTNLIKDYKVAMDGYFSDLGTEVNRHANANNKLEELL